MCLKCRIDCSWYRGHDDPNELACKECDCFGQHFNENDDEGKDNHKKVDNNDDDNNGEEENNLVTDSLAMDTEREDGSRDARNKPSCMREKMGENLVVS